MRKVVNVTSSCLAIVVLLTAVVSQAATTVNPTHPYAYVTNVGAWSSRPTRLYYVEATNAMPLGASGWADVGGGLIGPPASSPQQTAIAQAGATATFYRVRAVVPLSE